MPIEWRTVFDAEPEQVYRVEAAGRTVEVPCFVPGLHYAKNFAEQWSRFRNTQLDSANGTTISRDFLKRLLFDSLESLHGKTVLEIGAGAGRFTEHLVRHAKLVVAVDLSEAILVNAALGVENLVAAQIDLLKPPPMKVQFDAVFCRGVLQHTPEPKEAIAAIHRLASPGGLVVFDIYGPTGRLGNLEPKYAWRGIIPHVFSQDSFSRFLDRHARRLLRLRWRLKPLFRWKMRRLLDYLIPIADYKGGLPLTEDQLVEWGKLDTVDAMFAKYDKPMKYAEVVKVVESIDATVVASDHEYNLFKTRTSGVSRTPGR